MILSILHAFAVAVNLATQCACHHSPLPTEPFVSSDCETVSIQQLLLLNPRPGQHRLSFLSW